MSRIQLNDSYMDMFLKMAEGNPGAISVLMPIYQQGSNIDPDSALGSIGTIFGLDTDEIYGSDIWGLYKVCNESVVAVITVMRARQLGFISPTVIKEAISTYPTGKLPVNDLYKQVKEYLPNFDPNNEFQS